MTRPRLTSIRPRVDQTASFFCTTCGGDRPGEVCDGRRHIAVGPVAVLPWTRAGGHVRCATCDSQHPLAALDVITTAEFALRLARATRALAATTVRTGDPSDPRLRCRAVQHVRTAIPGYHQGQLDADMVAVDPTEAARYVASLTEALDTAGMERIIADMATIALAAHTVSSHQRWVMDRVGAMLGLTPACVTGIISAVAASTEPSTEDPADRP